ncbi:hypothetical protein Pmar_PMAR020168 [Perkinsus marinus ATCC 50983]|uniref:Uncharacterized protein n=1 Tax=Perkinsus marinus (strain ATCC 50983 / TXsc) TaxID=423536 RepID=C5LPU4_PERM5|nr:hypothetical protein Pmar_PMAR020168 [Perkinsus marinus ATCC 50983]EER01262.1 hypothetical protein Pmar_PMAR020168 [Perkinsus marinus ATCC 50983]|eukprot:XP_002768544.1 hypothetical protein Pmar_PMAR020168 [Perkinsus marinus ATCC 50983]
MGVVTAVEMELSDVLPLQDDGTRQLMGCSDSSPYLRGVPLSTVAKKRHLFRDSQGNEDTYTLSRSVDHLDAFVSHSWSANPPLKHMGLVASQYYFLGYIVANAVVICVGAGLSFAVTDRIAFLFAFVASVISFLLALFFGCRIPGYKHAMIFLDKCCISQTDQVAKLRGIRGLSSFLGKSNELLILWSRDYFKRLWCVFEVASFLQQHGLERKIHLVSIRQTKFAFIIFGAEVFTIIIVSVLGIVSADMEMKTPYYACMLGACFMMAAFLGVFIVYEYLPHRLTLHRQASEFTVADGECLLEEDRLLIRDLIKKWYGSLEAFEEYVRGHKEYITGRSRPWTVSALTLAIISLPTVLACVGRAVTIWCSQPFSDTLLWWRTLSCFIPTLTLLLCRMPLLVFAAYACFEQKRKPRWIEAVSMVSLVLVYETLVLLTGGTMLFDKTLMGIVPELNASLFTIVIPLLALLNTFLLYRRNLSIALKYRAKTCT